MSKKLYSPHRRNILRGAGALGLIGVTGMPIWRPAMAQGQIAVTLADIGVGDPGDWSRLAEQAGVDVKVIAIGNAPSAVINQLVAGGGRDTYDIVNIVGGMQQPLVETGLIDPIDISRLSNWDKNTYIQQFLDPDTPGYEFISYDGQIYGIPTVLQGESFAYLPQHTGELNSYGALFDPKFRGYVALEDNYTTGGQKVALYMKANGLADIADPADMTPEELDTVIDFLIEKKKDGQFRVIWSSFEQAVSLLANEEVYVMDCWEPIVYAARDKGVDVVYADPEEGYLLWAMAAYIVNNPGRSEEQTQAIYDTLDFMLGPWYGATITLNQGYMTNPQAPQFAEQNPDLFTAEQAAEIVKIHDNVEQKFAVGGSWQNRWPTHVDAYEDAWQRFKAS